MRFGFVWFIVSFRRQYEHEWSYYYWIFTQLLIRYWSWFLHWLRATSCLKKPRDSFCLFFSLLYISSTFLRILTDYSNTHLVLWSRSLAHVAGLAWCSQNGLWCMRARTQKQSQVFGIISNEDDSNRLQADLLELERLQDRWEMGFIPSMCKLICISNNKSPPLFCWSELDQVDSVSYLGVTLTNKQPHVVPAFLVRRAKSLV